MEDYKELFDSLFSHIKGERVPINPGCEICNQPDYQAFEDLVYHYKFCLHCGSIKDSFDEPERIEWRCYENE